MRLPSERTRETALFVHSTGTGPAMWQAVPTSALFGRRVCVPANLGYPPNPSIARGERITADDDARELLRALPEGRERVHLVAHSYGAFVALRLLEPLGERVASALLYEPVLFGALAKASAAEADPAAIEEVRAFVADASFTGDEEQGGRAAWLERFVDYWNRPGAWSKLPDASREQLLGLGWTMFQEVRACFADETPFSAWRLPGALTIVLGERSPLASRAIALALARGRPNATVVELPGVGHMGPVTHPPAVHEAIRQHFVRLDGGEAR